MVGWLVGWLRSGIGDRGERRDEGKKEERNTPQAKTFPYKAIHLCRHSISELDMVVVVNGEKGGGGGDAGDGGRGENGEDGEDRENMGCAVRMIRPCEVVFPTACPRDNSPYCTTGRRRIAWTHR